MTQYTTKVLPSGAVIKIPDPSQFPSKEIPQALTEEKLNKIEEAQDLLIMMLLEKDGII